MRSIVLVQLQMCKEKKCMASFTMIITMCEAARCEWHLQGHWCVSNLLSKSCICKHLAVLFQGGQPQADLVLRTKQACCILVLRWQYSHKRCSKAENAAGDHVK